MVVGTQMLHRKCGARHKTAMGQKRRFDLLPMTSGLSPLTDILRVNRNVSNVPLAEVLSKWAVMGKANSVCQSALEWAPLSASKRDPFDRRVLLVALASSELVGVAEMARARVV
jgi:hypothetical protein